MKLSSQFMIFAVAMGIILGTQVTTIGIAQGQPANTPDPTVKAALEKANLTYEILDNGNFKVVMRFSDSGRKQSVYINSSLDQVSTSSLRKVYAFPANARLDDRTMDYAFAQSELDVIGGWEANSDGTLARVAKVNSSLDAKALRAVIADIAAGTDSLEREMGLADEK